ncbi:BTAD domain-containing putative transcriptional regulator [Umezawaea endophytica]|uniref:Tetratricopeptide repeat protein n=1 Tax=Umezawaea endophytica TaxID=1654476 RepID=A0A9X3AFC6_9PSEU|nr:BTAD domain-containing putative transcriptional regulator [Umezawaea endophytica]MCS7478081.1 tetratricopeptide repeat protein [Umezawaea endophytica]
MEFRLLGGVEVWHGGARLDVGPARQRCVLAVLLVEVNTIVPVDRLVDRVWGDRAPQRARATLHTYLTRLRRALPGVPITHRSGGYVLSTAPETVDLHRFRALVRQARTSATDDVETLFAQADDLWRGEPFEDLDTPWLTGVRAELGRERHAADLDRTDLVLRRGGGPALIAPLTGRAQRHPLDERLAAQLATALYRAGRQADALDHLRRVRSRLRDELGVDPGPHLADLHRRVLAADPRLTEPVPRQLPAAPTAFAGRADDLAALDPNAPLLLITGTGGVGKTWLALHWAHGQRFPDGQLFVDLRGFDPTGEPLDPDTALRGFLDALGVPPAAMPPDTGSRAALYRSLLADRRMLVVLDNARDAAQVVPLLPGTSGSTVVVTSRDRLAGLVTAHLARPLHLDVLSEVDSRAVLARRLGTGRVPDDDLLEWCGGLPLALALVAGQALAHPGFPLERPDHGDLSTVLSWSYRALPPEQASAFRLLGGVPGPDIGVAAAVAATGRPESVLRALERASLLTAHVPGRYRMHDLVRRYAADLPDQDRPAALARLLNHWTRTAGAARLPLDPEPSPIPLAPEGSFADDTAALRWFDTEHECLLAALRTTDDDLAVWHLVWALHPFHFRRAHHGHQVESWRRALAAAENLGDEHALAVAHQLFGHACSLVGRLDESLAHLERALERGRDQRFEGHVRLSLAATWFLRADNGRALEQAHDAVRLFRAAGDRLWEAIALTAAGFATARLGDLDRARGLCAESLALGRSHGNRHGVAGALDALGVVAHEDGRHADAVEHHREALALHEELNAPHSAAETLERLGHPYAALGRTAEAHDAWRRASALYRSQRRLADADRVASRVPPGS